MISGVTDIALTLFDVLMDVPDLKICVAYELDGKEIHSVPASEPDYTRCKPIYRKFETIPRFDTKAIRKREALPKEAEAYLSFIENYLHARISLLGLGPDREETLVLHELFD